MISVACAVRRPPVRGERGGRTRLPTEAEPNADTLAEPPRVTGVAPGPPPDRVTACVTAPPAPRGHTEERLREEDAGRIRGGGGVRVPGHGRGAGPRSVPRPDARRREAPPRRVRPSGAAELPFRRRILQPFTTPSGRGRRHAPATCLSPFAFPGDHVPNGPRCRPPAAAPGIAEPHGKGKCGASPPFPRRDPADTELPHGTPVFHHAPKGTTRFPARHPLPAGTAVDPRPDGTCARRREPPGRRRAPGTAGRGSAHAFSGSGGRGGRSRPPRRRCGSPAAGPAAVTSAR